MTEHPPRIPALAVTGASGFIGRAVVERAVAEGAAVRGLVRRPEAVAELAKLGAEPVRGDLSQPGATRGLVAPGATVIHAAARVDLWGSRAAFEAATVAGTRHLLDEALPQRPARFVYLSSAGVYMGQTGRGPYSAARTRPRLPRHHFYSRAKLAAEQLVRQRCEAAGVPWTILRLGFVYGPGARSLCAQIETAVRRGQLRIIGSGDNRLATLYIDDAVAAIMTAAAHPAAVGQVFDVASSEPVTQRQFIDGMAEALGYSRVTASVPMWVALAAGVAAENLGEWTGRRPPFTRVSVELMGRPHDLDCTAIERKLGWRPGVPFAEGMQRLAAWLAESR